MISVTIPIRTVSGMNVREHWGKKARRVRSEREAACLIFPYGVKLPCVVTFTRIAPRELDGDNLQSSMKGIRDGVADKLGIDDRDARVVWRYQQRYGKPKEYAVLVEVE